MVRLAWAGYLAVAVVAELLLPVVPVASALLDATVLVLALTHFGVSQRSPLAIGDPGVRLLPAVALLPLLRLLSLTMPAPALPRIVWLALAGAPMLLAVPAAARLATLDVREIALTRLSRAPASILVAAAGLPAGLLIGRLAVSPFAISDQAPLTALATGIVLIACAALPEELIFRGILQPLMVDRLGLAAIPIVGLVGGATYVGTGSLAIVGVMTVIGILYGWEVWRSGSIWGPVVSHSLLLLTSVALAPRIFGA